MLFPWETQTIKHGLWENPGPSVVHRHMHVCELSYMAGRGGLVGLGLFAIEEHTIEAYWKSRTTRCHAQEDDVIKDTHASGRESMDLILSECLKAVSEMARHGGFARAQWVLSRLPRNPSTMGDEDKSLDIGPLQAQADRPTTVGGRLRRMKLQNIDGHRCLELLRHMQHVADAEDFKTWSRLRFDSPRHCGFHVRCQ